MQLEWLPAGFAVLLGATGTQYRVTSGSSAYSGTCQGKTSYKLPGHSNFSVTD